MTEAKTRTWLKKNADISLRGKTVVVTGANSGVGYKTAETMLYLGAKVILACRNPEKAEAARSALAAEYPESEITVLKLDLADLSAIEAFVAQIRAQAIDIDVFVNNAGVLHPPVKETKDGFILFNWTFDTHNVIVRNCNFHDNRARALLILARDVTVENNVFRHQEMGAIKIETGYTYNLWSEGYGVSNVVIRGNLFDTVNPSGSYVSHRQRSIYTGIYLRTDPSQDTTDYPIIRDILIDGNTFRDNTGVTAYLSSVSNVVVRRNVIEDPTPRRKESPFRSQFFLTNARDVRIVDNVYRASPNVRQPGVAFDPENCSGIVVDGNRIVDGGVDGTCPQ